MTETASISLSRPLRFPDHYTWFVFVSALDIMFTWIVLYHDGWEANAIADRIIENFGLPGLVVYKFSIVIFVICLAEIIARRKHGTAQRLMEWAIAITSIPVAVAIIQLLMHATGSQLA